MPATAGYLAASGKNPGRDNRMAPPSARAVGLRAGRLLAFAEAALLVGFFIPGETAVVVGGVLAGLGRVNLPR